VMTALPLHSMFIEVDPLALLIVSVAASAADGQAVLAICAAVNELRNGLRNFILGLFCRA
jgi:hypothetical protein